MAEPRERPLDELLFGSRGARAVPAGASLAEALAAWYRAEAAKLTDGATCPRADRPRPDTNHKPLA